MKGSIGYIRLKNPGLYFWRSLKCLSILAFFVLCAWPFKSYAVQSCLFVFQHEHPYANVHLYRVASGNKQTGFQPHPDYDACGIDFNQLLEENLSETAGRLHDHVQQTGLQPDHILTLNTQGEAHHECFEDGIYLVSGSEHTSDSGTVRINPIILYSESGKKQTVFLKDETAEVPGKQIQLKKEWISSSGETIAPAASEITLRIEADGQPYATIRITQAGGWKADLYIPETVTDWTIQEMKIPEGFTAKILHISNDFTIYNQQIPGDDEEDPYHNHPIPQRPNTGGSSGSEPNRERADPKKPNTSASTKANVYAFFLVLAGSGILILNRLQEEAASKG